MYRFRMLGLFGMDNWINYQLIANGLIYKTMFILNYYMVKAYGLLSVLIGT